MSHLPPTFHFRPWGGSRLTSWLTACVASLTLALPAFSAPATEQSLKGLLAIARRANPELEASRLRYQAARSRTGFAGTLEPPQLNLSLMDFWGLGGPTAAVTQMIPLGQKRPLENAMAVREAEMAKAEYEAKWLMVASEVKQAYYELLYLEKALAINEATREQVKTLQKVANARYAVGAAAQQDSLRSQVELSRLYDRAFDLAQQAQSMRNRLNTLLNRPVNDALELPQDFPAEPEAPTASTALAQAEARNPMLQAARAAVAAQQSRQALANEETNAPDMEVGIEAGRTMPGDMAYLGGMVQVTLPWLTPGRNQARIAEAEQSAASAQAAFEAQRASLRYRVQDRLNQIRRSDQRLELYRKGLFSQTGQSMRAALAAYQVSKADFSTVIEAQMAVFDTQMAYAMAQAEYFKLLAMLEADLNLQDPMSTQGEE